MNICKRLDIYTVLLSLLVVFSGTGTAPASGQSLHEPWSTLETTHFRIHYPDAYKDWTEHLARRIESIHDRVTVLVDYEPAHRVDIVVADPLSMSNGLALPFLKKPRMVLFTTPPFSGSPIGFYQDWIELLAAHEYVHITHLIRPSRNKIDRFLGHLVPVGPIARKSPNWIVEGYATLLEGKLTGRGRPNGSFRAVFLREMAIAGLLPTYGELNGGNRWAAGAFPYLFGSVFLEWLQEREGPESLVHLWRRLTAKKRRSFNDAFKGVFREPPDELYGKFKAETTARAMNLKRKLEIDGLNEGEPWQKIYRSVSPPSLSPDGEAMALVIYSKNHPPRLEVWSTTEIDEEKKKKYDDPEDVPDKPAAPPKRKVLSSLHTRNHAAPFEPRFLPDGEHIIFHRFMADKSGNLHPDLFLWQRQTGKIKRVTYQADIHSARPFDEGRRAVAIRSRFGKTQLVEVDLLSGAVNQLTELSLDVTYSQPVVSPDDKYVAVIIHKVGHWSLSIHDLKSFELKWSIGNGTEVLSYPTWHTDSESIFYISDRSGIPNIERFDTLTGKRSQISNILSGAIAPILDPSGSFLYYLRFWTKGLSIYRLDIPENPDPGSIVVDDYYPILPPRQLQAGLQFEERSLDPARPYSLGRQEFSTVTGFGFTTTGNGLQYGLRMGDIIGRNETILLGGITFSQGPVGGTVRQRLRRFPLEIFIQAFWCEEQLQEGKNITDTSKPLLDFRNYGILSTVSWDRKSTAYSARVTGSGLISEKTLLSIEEHLPRNLVELSGQLSFRQGRDDVTLFQHFQGSYQLGSTDDGVWTSSLSGAMVGISFYRSFSVYASYGLGALWGDFHQSDLFQVGGWRSSLLPPQALTNRITQPALEPGVLCGSEMERSRLTFDLGSTLPLVLYGEVFRTESSASGKSDPIRLLGLETRISIPQIALLNFPHTFLRLGVAKIYDEPQQDQINGYALMIIQP
ncbi:TolB family protein [candidate division CSSED10-310 bacterium]|uniref:TolB family protein n=1 Tax=candidate division CSSED10-310 bacterium TaxID=2855610 RepID=A0ABV6Z024_UNCC1